MSQATKRQERTEQFKIKDVEMSPNAEGKETYSVVVYPKFRNGWSNYTRDMFLWGDDPKALFHRLGGLKDSAVTLKIVSGRVKNNKQDDGQFDSYFWNVDSIAEGLPPSPQTPAAQAPSATEKPQAATPGPETPDAPSLGGIGHESDWAGPFYYDVTEAAHQARVQWGQAVNLAVEATGRYKDFGREEDLGAYQRIIEVWANRFYPLIRKGPSLQEYDIDPETLPWDGPQPHQEPRDEAPAPVGGLGTLPPFPIRGEREAAVNYFLKAAKERYTLSQKEALAAIGGTWSGWVDKNGGDGEQALGAAWVLLGAK